MGDAPWLTIIGIGEDGPSGLSDASREALASAEIVIGAARHLTLLPPLAAELREWPVPFADGIAPLLALRGRPVVLLASGDPFWFGAGSSVTRHLDAGEWRALPAPSSFTFAAARLGWALEQTVCLGLHAAPLARLRPHLADGARMIVLLRDGAAVADLAAYLDALGFGATRIHVLEALAGPRERRRVFRADAGAPEDIAHPVTVGLDIAGTGAEALPLVPGRPERFFEHDGQITKAAVRAMTLAALAPHPGARLWDIGLGSGSVSIEWLLAHPRCEAVGFEADPERAARAARNAAALGVERLQIITARAPEGLERAPAPDAVFIGGGLSEALLTRLWAVLPEGVRVVANAVTLDSEALLTGWQARAGGRLLRLDLSEAVALGTRLGWRAAYPIVQWQGVR